MVVGGVGVEAMPVVVVLTEVREVAMVAAAREAEERVAPRAVVAMAVSRAAVTTVEASKEAVAAEAVAREVEGTEVEGTGRGVGLHAQHVWEYCQDNTRNDINPKENRLGHMLTRLPHKHPYQIL